MKILLLGFAKLKLMPYAKFYLDYIDHHSNEVHLIYWNRDLKEEDLSQYSEIHLHEFRKQVDENRSKIYRILDIISYRKFTNKIMKNIKFDLIISLHTMPGIILYDKIVSKYNYIFDYRDHTYENNYLFSKLVKSYSKNAKVTFVSSNGFRQFLPDSNSTEIITSHNILSDSLHHRDDRTKGYVTSNKVRLSFWGLLRNPIHNQQILKKLGNDLRFEIHYYGKDNQVTSFLKNFCIENNIKNTFFHGEYKPEERYEFIKTTDIIHNSYYDENMQLAMSNKYYDGIIFKIPQLCMIGSYMGKQCTQNGVGCALDPNTNNYADELYNYIKQLNRNEFEKNCDVELTKIIKEYDYGINIIKKLTSD